MTEFAENVLIKTPEGYSIAAYDLDSMPEGAARVAYLISCDPPIDNRTKASLNWDCKPETCASWGEIDAAARNGVVQFIKHADGEPGAGERQWHVARAVLIRD